MATLTRRRSSRKPADDAAIAGGRLGRTPRLQNRLKELEAIESAARRVHEPASAGADARIDEDLRYLDDKLIGYELLERLDHGGQGAVFKARQTSTDRLVAIKVLLDGPLATDHQRQRFAREVELASRLRHPNIVTLYDSGIVRGRYFFAMEYVEGLPIHDYALLHALSVRDRVRLFILVCRAVNSAHQHGIIHRDLKPANILVDRDGQPHVLDFGLAKDLWSRETSSSDVSLSVPGQVVGTLPYLSPEQVVGKVEEVDTRSDVYSLGVLLYELLTERYPYAVGGDSDDVRENILSREPARLRQALSDDDSCGSARSGDLDEDIEAIVFKALEKEKDRRYAFAADFADDLERYLRGEAVVAKAGRRLYLLRKTLRRYRVPVGVAGAFLVVLVGALVATTLAWRQADQARQQAEANARTYQAGLQMGSYLKLGSVERDEGRVDQALAMFEKAVEIGESVPTSDPIMLRYLYGAHHRLAELHYSRGAVEKADPHCRAALEIVEALVKNEPGNLEWRRLFGYSRMLRGQMRFARQDWDRALEDFRAAESIRREFLARDPESTSRKSALVNALSWMGRCCRELGRYEESFEYYTAMYGLAKELVESEPDVLDHKIEMSRSELKLGVWHMCQRTPEHDRLASDWFQRAEDRLLQLATPRARQRDVTTIIKDIQTNRGILAERAEGGN